ncbi:endodeoxyribonuclease [Lecanicillium sp. MT-2017a]|nr:endodeoxyribonuclease [Lecanicillium sp. MT-2017a]
MELSNSFNLRNRDEDHRFYHSRSHENHAGSVIARLESTLEAIIDKLAQGEELSVEFQSRRRTFQGPAGIQEQQVRFPGRSPLEARKFGRRTEYQWRSGPLLISSLARLLLVLQLAHQALTSGVIFTKRHIYYQHQDLFETQQNVDEIVDDVAFTLGIGRNDLNITASPKGLFVGHIELQFNDAINTESMTQNIVEPLPAMNMSESGSSSQVATIPMVRSIAAVNISNAKWLLVVEKDAKGYPDLMTRSFLGLTQTHAPELPMLVLTDYDPYGINIFVCYRCGTKSFAHESSLNILNVTWLGIKSSHLLEQVSTDSLQQGTQGSSLSGTSQQRDAITVLSLRDRKYAIGLLHRISEDGMHSSAGFEVRRELQVQLLLGVKGEIEDVDNHSHLIPWLDNKLQEILSP